MPIRINEILANNEQEVNQLGDDVLSLIQEEKGTLSGFYDDKNSSMHMQTYDLFDEYTGEKVLRCVFTLKTLEADRELRDIDVIIPNNNIQELDFISKDEGVSEASQMWTIEKDDKRTQLEVVNRYVLGREINGKETVSLSAMPYDEILFGKDQFELNELCGFKPTVYKWQESIGMGKDPITLGFAPDFVGMGMMICQIESHKKICVRIGENCYSAFVVNLKTGLGEMPALLPIKYEDKIIDGYFIRMFADVKADFAVNDKNYYDKYSYDISFLSKEFNDYYPNNVYVSYGLGALKSNRNALFHLLGKVLKEGTHIKNYYGTDYVNCWFKSNGCPAVKDNELSGSDCQIVLDTTREGNDLKITGFDMHSVGECVAKFMIAEEYRSPLGRSKSRKQLILKSKENGKNFLFVNVINSDVLPSFLPGDVVDLQLVGTAIDFKYFESEEEYKKYTEDNQTLYLEDGELLSKGWLINYASGLEESERHHQIDDYVEVRGKALIPYVNSIEYSPGEELTKYCHVYVQTKLGYLDIAHQLSGLVEDSIKKIHHDAIFVGTIKLQGDAKMDDYDDGICINEENNLKALRYALYTDQPERLESFICDNVTLDFGKIDLTKEDANGYDIENSGTQLFKQGVEELKDIVHDYYEEVSGSKTYLAEIVKKPENAEFDIGRKCVYFSGAERNQSDMLVFIDNDETGKVKRIYFRDNYDYSISVHVPTEFLNE